MKAVILDSGPLGLLCHASPPPQALVCQRWAADLKAAGHRVLIPEIADYEVRRGLLLANRVRSVTELDALQNQFEYLPISTAAMRRAAELWALARQTGQPTAGDNTIDADMILIAQAETLGAPNTVIATTNLRHLSRFFPAELWPNVTP